MFFGKILTAQSPTHLGCLASRRTLASAAESQLAASCGWRPRFEFELSKKNRKLMVLLEGNISIA